ncbi:hypothetical protein AsFPU1_2909 [Aphanothece sacrum FPU1]|uniref:DUF29 domain-containing protein n=1 Tax=Aphanothece sacrum FPU1 TaxID=1920663 RepID=A0A401IJL0_APHSA|nr:hypothetical protein AsFPU1_2909 [Aphanothece sacrum FPU1]GBF86404.1 hypothetical protein AsFPU3_3475 [Aphanothece sacrum FPU3]
MAVPTGKKTNSWQYSIIKHRRRLERQLEDSPSLRTYLTIRFNYCYEYARKEAAAETELNLNIFPKICPFTLENVLNPDYLR